MSNTEQYIVCDTNIWYHIADSTIKAESIIDKKLIGTFVSAYEFCASFMSVTNYGLLQDAVRALNEKARGICSQEPLEYIKALSGYEYNSEMWQGVQMNLDLILTFSSLPDNNAARKVLQDNQDFVNSKNQSVLNLLGERRHLLQNTKNFKALIEHPDGKTIHLEQTKKMFESLTPGVVIDWSQFELFIRTCDEWFRQLALIKNMKITPRDWDDIFNLVYVQPGSLYWTNDLRKTKRMIVECGCSHYLYVL